MLAPTLTCAGNYQVKTGNYDNQAVVQSPRPESIRRHSLERPIIVIPPEQSVMSRRIWIIFGAQNRQVFDVRSNRACRLHK